MSNVQVTGKDTTRIEDVSTGATVESFERALAAYLEAVESGQCIDRMAWLAEHPQHRGLFEEYFQAEDSVAALTNRQPGSSHESSFSESFGPYVLGQQLGHGGMGVVYRARHVALDRTVALKLIRTSELSTELSARRFQNEAETASRLDHPNIVPIYDFGSQDGQYFLAMKLVEGCTLADWHGSQMTFSQRKQQDRAGLQQIATIVRDVARAVHHAHQRGVLHRDLKPSNILLDKDGHPYVADFGLAKQVDANHDITVAGAILGTPSYMSPEQARATSVASDTSSESTAAITTSSDVYGLGAVLYFMLTGQPPVRGRRR